MRWVLLLGMSWLTGCALHLTREQESMQQVCEAVSVEALNARDAAIKADAQRHFDELSHRIDEVRTSEQSVDRRLDELLALAHSRYYGWRAH
jgi:hypothetical protein